LKSASSNPWPTVRLGEVASVSTGGTPRRDRPEYWGGDIHWVTTGQIDFAVIQEGAERISEVGLRSSAAKISPAGTILMAMFGQGATRGKVGVLGIDAAFNQACAAIEPRNGYDRRFMYHYLADQYERIRALGQAGTQSNLNATLIRSIPVPNPPSQLQRFVGQMLDLWDDATERIDRLIGAKGRLRNGLAQALLTGRRRLPAFAGRAWREVRIGEVMQEVHRPVEWDDEAVYDLVSVRRWAGGVYTRQQLRGGDIKVKKLRRIQSGDILISHIQSAYGAMAMVGDDHDGHCVSDLYTVLVPRRAAKIVPRYFAWLCRTRWMWHQAYVSSNGFLAERLRVNFDPATFLDRVIRIPGTPDEQSAIADILDAAMREIDALTRLREAGAKQKRGLMQQLLTGRLRVPEVDDA